MNGSSAQFNAIVTIVGSVLPLAYTPPDTGVTAAFLHDGPALILGLLLGIVGTTSGLAAVWLLAGGKASIIQLGFGALAGCGSRRRARCWLSRGYLSRCRPTASDDGRGSPACRSSRV